MKKNNFVEGTVIATAVIIIVKLLGLLYVIPFYQIVGDQGGDLYSYAYNIYMIFLSISSAGLPDAIAKIISEYNALEMEDAKNRAYIIGKKIISIISITSFLILFVFAEEIGLFIIGNIKGGNTAEDIAFVIRCLSPAVLLIPFLSITKGFLQGHKYISASSMSQLIEQIVRIFVILAGSFLAYKVFRGTLSLAVGIAVSGAFFGGLAAYLYLKRIINKNNLLKEPKTKDKITNREITKKIILYAIPFVIISVINSLYNETDQILVLRLLEYLKFDSN
jgi:O-antigen/teichoic acid export membrane protein